MEKLLVSPNPHLRSRTTTRTLMLDVIIALCPALAASVWLFGIRALILVAVSVASCVVFEYISRKVLRRENTIGDLSAVVTGILLAFNLPPTIHPLIAVFGALVAIVMVKQLFGGLGQNFVNPALTARIVLMVSFPNPMSTWMVPFSGADVVTAATPLGILNGAPGTLPSYLDLFLGKSGGSLGEVCILALLLGGIYLLIRRVISPVVPVSFLATVSLMSLIAGRGVIVDLLTGGVVLGAIFMATDYVTGPMEWRGRVVFGIGCGFITMMIRLFGALPEGVSYAIILMNIISPLIERKLGPKAFGRKGAAS